MFSLQLKTIFRVLGTALLSLAEMPETKVEMSGSEYIASLDKPDAGKELPDVTTGTPAQVFDAAATVFGAGAGAAPNTVATYTMTAAAGDFTREEYHATGWTDDALVDAGMMVVEGPKPAPAIAAVAAPQTAPVATPDTLTPPTPSPAPTNTAPQPPAAASQAVPAPANAASDAVQVNPAHAIKDSFGLPWDARIHSGQRTINADGGWKKKKGVSDVELARVTAELRQAPVATPFTPLAGGAPAPAAPAPAAPPLPVAAAAASPAPAPQAPVANGTIETFAELCKWITANGFTMSQGLDKAKPYGIAAMGFLAQPSNAYIIPLVHADLLASRAV